jgi:uncharacterized Zn-finger protein
VASTSGLKKQRAQKRKASSAVEDPPLEKKSKFQCEVCNKDFTKKGSLNRHMKTHTEKKSKFQCEVCEKVCSTKSNLKRHMTTHAENRREFPCDLCTTVCSTNANLQRHIEVEHLVQEKKIRL